MEKKGGVVVDISRVGRVVIPMFMVYKLSSGGTVVTFSSAWNSAGKGKDGATRLTREAGDSTLRHHQ